MCATMIILPSFSIFSIKGKYYFIDCSSVIIFQLSWQYSHCLDMTICFKHSLTKYCNMIWNDIDKWQHGRNKFRYINRSINISSYRRKFQTCRTAGLRWVLISLWKRWSELSSIWWSRDNSPKTSPRIRNNWKYRERYIIGFENHEDGDEYSHIAWSAK